MMRLFVALGLPDAVAEGLLLLQGGIPGARWSAREQLHLTLRFIGEVDGRDATAIDDALASIRAARFTLELKGMGEFGGKNPRALWAGVRDDRPVLHLQRKIESALQRIGLPAEERKFTAHVTLARLRAAPRDRVITFLAAHALYASVPFEVNCFILYSSTLGAHGSLYRQERAYGLDG
ncbi:MAG TPA: RNA 2',3'-cyclic phosphodiesterase [Rhizomicrobium sp.]|jgi:2'-5' RNA ligase|nr:RNA 2',3'-cyclic phosphodiesterase [Rhizomicrobium sp.]